VIIGTFAIRGSFATINALGSGELLVIGGYDDRINYDKRPASSASPTLDITDPTLLCRGPIDQKRVNRGEAAGP
jgi:hypothetical protein